ncbi:MAG: IS200/IS605 family accessory protein TnpB-related protein, partial [archaeon]|nr:IS200/IS605 family accessory protein TnpB-related protein [archaeon]
RSNGLLIETRYHHFPEVNSPGYPAKKAKDTRLKALSELIEYAAAQDVKTFVFEKLKMKGRKDISSKTGNRKLSKFAARELLSHAEVMVKKRGGEFKQVNPAYGSRNARIINLDLGMDVHSASALVLGLRYLHTPKTT